MGNDFSFVIHAIHAIHAHPRLSALIHAPGMSYLMMLAQAHAAQVR